MEKLLLIGIWFAVSIALWLLVTCTAINSEKNKKWEFRLKTVCYWLAVIIALLLGIKL